MADPTPPAPRVTKVNDETLRRFVGYRLKRTFNVLRSDLIAVLEPLGLRILTYSALVLIVDNPGLRPSQLADALAIERPNLVVVLDELEQRALIVRRSDQKDRRAHVLTATEAGQRLCARAVAADEAHEAKLLAEVPAVDREVLLSVLGRIERAKSEVRPCVRR